MKIGEIVREGTRETPGWAPDPNFVPDPVPEKAPEKVPEKTPEKVD